MPNGLNESLPVGINSLNLLISLNSYECFHGETVRIKPEAADYSFACCGDHALMAKSLARVYVANVHFDDGHVERTYAIVQGDAGVGVGSCVEGYAIYSFAVGLLESINEEALHVALIIEDFVVRITLTKAVKTFVHCACAVDARLAFAQHVEVGTVKN